MNNELIMYGLMGSTLIVLVASWVYDVWYQRYLQRVIDQQIRDGVVPLNYSEVVRATATVRNDEVLGGRLTPDQERQAVDLDRLRWHVAGIRVKGFDAAKRAESFSDILTNNPYDKGTGEAKQWARGFCQGYGKGGHPPAGWMERA